MAWDTARHAGGAEMKIDLCTVLIHCSWSWAYECDPLSFTFEVLIFCCRRPSPRNITKNRGPICFHTVANSFNVYKLVMFLWMHNILANNVNKQCLFFACRWKVKFCTTPENKIRRSVHISYSSPALFTYKHIQMFAYSNWHSAPSNLQVRGPFTGNVTWFNFMKKRSDGILNQQHLFNNKDLHTDWAAPWEPCQQFGSGIQKAAVRVRKRPVI